MAKGVIANEREIVMKRSNSAVHYLIAMLISVTPAAFGQGMVAATVPGAESPNAKPTAAAVTDSAPLPFKMQTATNRLPLALFIDAPTAGTFQLVYVPDEGWKYADRAMGVKPIEAALTPTAMPRSDEGSAADEPLTVFIDGPTGFTYVWMRDTGWKFVGRVSDWRR